MAGNKTAQQIAQSWSASMGSQQTQQNYIQGVQNCPVNPMQLAAQASDRYAAGVQNAVNSGKYQQALNNTPVQTWKTNATSKASRLSGGATAAQAKYASAMQKWAPVYAEASQAAKAVQGSGFAAAQQKWAAAVQVLMNAAGKQ